MLFGLRPMDKMILFGIPRKGYLLIRGRRISIAVGFVIRARLLCMPTDTEVHLQLLLPLRCQEMMFRSLVILSWMPF